MSEFTAYYCNQYLTEELNGRIERRLRGTETLEPFFEASQYQQVRNNAIV